MQNNLFLTWSARLISLFLLTVTIVLGIMTYGMAESGVQVKVDRKVDDSFAVSQANVLSSGWAGNNLGEGSLMIPVDQNILSYVSDAKKSEFDFWMVGVKMKAEMPVGTSVEMSVRVSADNEQWSDWQSVELEKMLDDEKTLVAENPIMFDQKARYAQYSLILNSDTKNLSPVVKNVEIMFINPDDQLALVKKGWNWMMENVMGKEKINIISREEWNADESIMTWNDMEYAKVQQVIIHHTAGGSNAPADPAAVVRGIYYFHAVEKDWGDIGYNYLIDQHGNVYEGRKGGLGVVGAHVSGNNYGSVGIALIGNYNESAPSGNMLSGLIDLLEYIADQTGIDLTANHNFEDKNIPVVAGHRDVNSTECPGDVLYGMLADAASAAKSGMGEVLPKEYAGQYVGQSDNAVDLANGQTAEINVSFKNSGDEAWFAEDGIKVVPVDPYPRNSGFAADDWQSTQVVGLVAKKTVMPDEEVVFKLSLKGIDDNGNYDESFALLGPNGIMEGTNFAVSINNSEQNNISENENNNNNTNNQEQNTVDDNLKNASLYQATWLGQSDSLTVVVGEEKTAWIDIKNSGEIAWQRDGQYPVRLGTTEPNDRHSSFVTGSGWIADNRIQMVQAEVEPGETARFRFSMKGVDKPGVYREYFRPVVEGVTWMNDLGIYMEVTVQDGQNSAELVNISDRQVELTAGKKTRTWVELKNTGNTVWRNSGDNPVRLGTSNEMDHAGILYSKDYWVSENRAANMKKTMVNPGETARFEVVVTAPDEPGVYREYFRPVVENVGWLSDADIWWEVVVK